jgi:hypothetical protein
MAFATISAVYEWCFNAQVWKMNPALIGQHAIAKPPAKRVDRDPYYWLAAKAAAGID